MNAMVQVNDMVDRNWSRPEPGDPEARVGELAGTGRSLVLVLVRRVDEEVAGWGVSKQWVSTGSDGWAWIS